MTALARVLAQAKVNLRLRVLARESTGYHSIETIFLRLELGDDVQVRIAAGRSIDCAGPAVPAGGLPPAESNLAFRAAAAYAHASGWPAGFAIEIDKQIPVGGGLGGGSADAGAVLRALDALSPRPLGSRLIELATPLGADVPFMATEHGMALGWGRGERLLALPAPPPRPVLLAVPPFAIPTAEAYQWLSASRDAYIPRAEVLDVAGLASWDALRALATNDFEAIVSERHPDIARTAGALRDADAAIAMLSGSGSTVFGIFGDGPTPDADAISQATGYAVLATRTSDRVATVTIEGVDN